MKDVINSSLLSFGNFVNHSSTEMIIFGLKILWMMVKEELLMMCLVVL